MSTLASKVLAVAATGALLAGCATNEPTPQAQKLDCKAELGRANAELAAEVAERQRLLRAAARREEALRKELDALKAIERNILDREEQRQSKAR